MPRRAGSVLTRAALALAFTLACACSKPAEDLTCEGAFRAWLDDMEASVDDPKRIQEAFQLLGPDSQSVLTARAERASQMMGKRFLPYEMLAQGKLGLKFRPKKYVSNPPTGGKVVHLRAMGADPGDHAEIICVDVPAAGKPHYRLEPDLAAETPPILRAK